MRPIDFPFTMTVANVSTDESTSVHTSDGLLLTVKMFDTDHLQQDMKRLESAFSPLQGSAIKPPDWRAL